VAAGGHGGGLSAVEQKIQTTLPFIPGLTEAASAEERAAILAHTTAVQRERFVQRYGTPFDHKEAKPCLRGEVLDQQTWPGSAVKFGS